MFRRAVLIGVVLPAIYVLAVAAAGAQEATPQAFLESIYKRYETSQAFVDIGSGAKAARYFTPYVAKLIAKDFAEAKKKNEVGRLDFDPFINGQDWTPTKIEVTVAPGAKPDQAIGTARFTPPDAKDVRSVILDLAKTPAGWRIANIRWEGFGEGTPESLVNILTAKE
jgi:hypothetical protein